MESPIYSGFFTSTGKNQQINFVPGVTGAIVTNYTAYPAASNLPFKFFWQLGMPQAGGLSYVNIGGVMTTAVLAGNGFQAFNNSTVTANPPAGLALTAITAANPPVVTTVATLPNLGDIVTFSNLTSAAGVGPGQRQIGGIPFTVTAVGGGTFTIGNINLSGSTASTAGLWRTLSNDPEFYPRQRVITYVTASSVGTVPVGSTRIYTSVTHQYVVGQKVNLEFPGGSAVWGNFAALNNVVVTITAINTARNGTEPNNALGDNNFDVAFDSSGYGTWTASIGGGLFYPAQYPQGPAIAIPFGEDMAYAIYANPVLPLPPIGALPVNNVLADSLDNVSSSGIILLGGAAAGAAGPAGAVGDLMFWQLVSAFDNFPPVNNPTTP